MEERESIRVALALGARVPSRGTPGSVGLDLHYHGPDRILWPWIRPTILRTGVYLELPPGFGAVILPRSSATKRGFVIAPGTIDTDYRGELAVAVQIRWPRRIRCGDRIAQLVSFYQGGLLDAIEVVELAALTRTDRGGAGWGSTGA